MDIAIFKENKNQPILILSHLKSLNDDIKVNNKSNKIENLKNKNSIKKIARIEIDIFENEQTGMSYEIGVKEFKKAPKRSLLTSESQFELYIQDESNASNRLLKNNNKSIKGLGFENTSQFHPPSRSIPGSNQNLNQIDQSLGINRHFKNLNLKIEKTKKDSNHETKNFWNTTHKKEFGNSIQTKMIHKCNLFFINLKSINL